MFSFLLSSWLWFFSSNIWLLHSFLACPDKANPLSPTARIQMIVFNVLTVPHLSEAREEGNIREEVSLLRCFVLTNTRGFLLFFFLVTLPTNSCFLFPIDVAQCIVPLNALVAYWPVTCISYLVCLCHLSALPGWIPICICAQNLGSILILLLCTNQIFT